MDGTSATATIQGDSIEIGPNMEAVEELQATTTGLDVKSAITNGGVIAFNLKSGTNKFHGSAFRVRPQRTAGCQHVGQRLYA